MFFYQLLNRPTTVVCGWYYAEISVLKMATCHCENQLLCFCTQLSTVRANKASSTPRVQHVFGSEILLVISFCLRHKRERTLCFIHGTLIRAPNGKGSHLTHWHVIAARDDYIRSLSAGLTKQIRWLFSPHVASLQCDLALVHMLTAGSLV